MPSETRLLIDYATGDNWEMPKELFERYHHEYLHFSNDGQTIIQQWMKSLAKEERELISKK